MSGITKLRNLANQFAQMQFPQSVRIVEVGARDGLQNEKTLVPTETKIQLIDRLSKCGFSSVEVTSFVSPKWVPQMQDNAQVFAGITKLENVRYPVLVPNDKGFQTALKSGVQEVAVFLSASETFSEKNINCSIEESIDRVSVICQDAYRQNIPVRGYISCIAGCPYEGFVKPSQVRHIANVLKSLQCYEISLGDTIGIGTPETTTEVIRQVLLDVPLEMLAVHYHDTYERALINIIHALQLGITTIDSSVASLGGCPYAKGATGNVSSEDVVFLLHELGVNTGIDLDKLADTAEWICQELGRENRSLFKKSTN